MFYFILLLVATVFLAYSNGANDNFKGVATLFGSRTTNYRTAIKWATATTLLGSLCSVLLAQRLLRTFSGDGLVPDALTASPDFLIAVAVGAASTVMLATVTGFPISTTHSLTGALMGAGLAAVGLELQFAALGTNFFLPLLVSPMLALTLSGLAYIFFRYWRLRLGVTEEWVVYVDRQEKLVPIAQPDSVFSFKALRSSLVREELRGQERQYVGHLFGWPVQKLLDKGHFFSAGVVSFARGLNDTPKIAALLLVVSALKIQWGVAIIGIAIALGGLLNARKVAETMSKKITPMNHGQGFTANLITGFLVIVASRLGVPVSTTHVSVGSLAGIGLVTRGADRKVLSNILLSWVLTLPLAALLGGVTFLLLQ